MCRAGGRRCPGQHGVAGRAARAAKERERYRAKALAAGRAYSPHKEKDVVTPEPVTVQPPKPALTSEPVRVVLREPVSIPVPSAAERAAQIANEKKAREFLSETENYYSPYETPSPNSVESVMTLALSNLSDLAVTPIKEQDTSFNCFTSNKVHRLVLENGTVGYWKSYQLNALESEEGAHAYEHIVFDTMKNEAAAYQLAQVLGKDYRNLVPETVIREYNGEVGSLQEDAKGVPLTSLGIQGISELNQDTMRKAAIFDIVAGSQDRHANNVIVREDENGELQPVLIDNGYSMRSTDTFLITSTLFTQYAKPAGRAGSKLTDKEKSDLWAFIDQGQYKMQDYVSARTLNGMVQRAKDLVTAGEFFDYNDKYGKY